MKRRLLLFACLPLMIAPAFAEEAAEPVIKAGEFTFKAAKPWVAKPTPASGMTKGGLTIPGKDGAAPVNADFYHFEGQGGDVESNVKRWQGQFEPGADGKPVELKREELKFGARKVHLVYLKGTYLSGAPMAPKKTPMPGYAMFGAILESERGAVFIKVTGPEAAVTAAKEDVKKLIASAYPAK